MDAPRRADFTDTRSVPELARRRSPLTSGAWGMILFICTEGAFFGTLIGSYFYLRFTNAAWPPRGIEAPSAALPIVLTACLVLTVGPMLLATRAATNGRVRLAQGLIAVA